MKRILSRISIGELGQRIPTEPIIVLGIAEEWSAKHWTSFELLSDFLGPVTFYDKEHNTHVTLEEYKSQVSPGYLFEFLGHDEDNKKQQKHLEILKSYSVPHFAKDDLFASAYYSAQDIMQDQKPQHRWLLVGRQGSGSTIHIDPNGTSAWNTLLCGRKRWTILQPCDTTTSQIWDCPASIKPDAEGRQQIETIFRMLGHEDDISKLDSGDLEYFEFDQNPGETVFIPPNWAHCVRNETEETIAITQNFAPPKDLNLVLNVIESYGGEWYREYWKHKFESTM